jgi:hypothetical protein
MSSHYRVNAPRFVHETVDGEALIMDMVKGSYYSCAGASAYAWNALARGVSTAALAKLIEERYGVASSDAGRDIDGFIATLLSEEMLFEASEPMGEVPTGDELASLVPSGDYAVLELERFTDLADLILLDPVHDVTEAGWPHPADDR